MGWEMVWPKCAHDAPTQTWEDGSYENGAGRRFDYRQARCVNCDRPLIAFGEPVSADERRMARRHVAFWYEGKEGEHASNTVVMPWPSNAPRRDEPEVIRAQLRRLRSAGP